VDSADDAGAIGVQWSDGQWWRQRFFSSRFGWYVDQINNKDGEQLVQAGGRSAHAKRSRRVYFEFTIHKDGSPSNVQLDRSSGSRRLDRRASEACSAWTPYGSLPAAYNQSTLRVSYYCEY